MFVHIQQDGMDSYHATGHICSSNAIPAAIIPPGHHAPIGLQNRERKAMAVQRRHTTCQLTGHSSGVTTITGVTPSKNAAVGFQSSKGCSRHSDAWGKWNRCAKIQAADAVKLGAGPAVIHRLAG